MHKANQVKALTLLNVEQRLVATFFYVRAAINLMKATDLRSSYFYLRGQLTPRILPDGLVQVIETQTQEENITSRKPMPGTLPGID